MAHRLEYRVDRQWRRLSWRRIGLVGLAVVMAGVLGRFGRPVVEQLKYRHLVGQCLAFRIPEDRVVYAANEEDSKKLHGRGEYGRPRRPLFWAVISERWFPSAYYRPAKYLELFPSSRADGVAFMGARSSPDGRRWLVVVELSHVEVSDLGEWLQIHPVVYAADVWKVGSRVKGAGRSGGGIRVYEAWRLKLYAGRPDPADPTRFVIPYSAMGLDGLIEGRLQYPAVNPSTGRERVEIDLKVIEGPLKGWL